MIDRAELADVKVYLARRNLILNKLVKLSTAAATRWASTDADLIRGQGSKQDKSKAPAGVRLNPPKGDGPPQKELSLYDHFLWRFAHEVKSLDYGHLLCTEAERDHEEYVHGRQQVPELSGEQADQVLRNCRGKSPAEVALWYRCDLLYVIRLRSSAGLDPETGMEPGEAPEVGRRRTESPSAVAEELLRSLLADGPRAASVIFTRAEEVGVGAATVKRVKARMGVESQKCAEGWRWKMPRSRRAVASPTG